MCIFIVEGSMEERRYCLYCHGETYSDDYGNCRACGAPRSEMRREVVVQGDFHVSSYHNTSGSSVFNIWDGTTGTVPSSTVWR